MSPLPERAIRPPLEPLDLGPIALRAWRAADTDAEFLLAGWRDPEVSRWSPVPTNASLDDARSWLAATTDDQPDRRVIDLVIVDSCTDEPLGEVGATQIDERSGTGVVGWWLIESARGSGRATLAVDCFAKWLFDVVGLQRLAAIIAVENTASLAVARRAGFEQGARLADGRLVFERRSPSATVRSRP